MSYRAKRTEVIENVEAIRTAQLACYEAFESFVEVPSPVPRPVEGLTKGSVPWRPGSGFDTLGWSPDGEVRGTYWVELSPQGTDFTVHGAIDIDGDGEPSHGVADRAGPFSWLVEDDW